MDFLEQLKQFSSRILSIMPNIMTEEATKNALILPFFQLLGYDIFNPIEFVPEFTADIGIKKGEKVDYAIMRDGCPVILIECKHCKETLEKHDSQLFRYFATCNVNLAILTNGIVYRFYTDLDAPNIMDLTPFMELDLLEIKEALIPELKRFRKSALDVESISDAASDLRYTNDIKAFITKQHHNPDESFVNYVIREVYPGRRTPQVSERFQGLIKHSFVQYFNELLNEKFKSMMEPKEPEGVNSVVEPSDDADDGKSLVETTQEELEALVIIRALVHETVDISRVTYKDTATYFAVLIDGKVTKWICRLYIQGRKKSIVFPGADGEKDNRHPINGNNDIYAFKNQLVERVKALIGC